MRRMPAILIVEDETAIADTIAYALRGEGYTAEHVLLGSAALERVRRGGIDLVLLDVGLPDRSGFDVCRELRGFSAVPVVFLTARNDEFDRVLGLELGADDYMAKPFSPRELVARVRARLRRHPGVAAAPEAVQRSGHFEHDADAHRIRYRGQALDLTRYEYALLAELLRRPGAILTRAQLLDRAWEDALESGERTVDTHVNTLRAKLRAVHPDTDPIHTHRGVGYSLDVG
jgi:two-component system catabolic regulation response regulator CreB